jgi:ATP-dependent Zn protease
MSTKLSNIIDKAAGYLPFLFMNGTLSLWLAPVIIILPIAIEALINYVYSLWYTEYTYQIYDKDEISNTNFTYVYISYILKKHNLLDQITLVECNKSMYDYSKGGYNNHQGPVYRVPVLVTAKSNKIRFVHNDFEVNIESVQYTEEHDKLSIKVRYYKITSKYYQHIQKFMEYINYIQAEYNSEYTKKEIHGYNYFDTKSTNWVKIPININKTFDTIFLDGDVKENIITNIDTFINGTADYARLGIARKIGFLLHGSPGNGKSSIIYAIAKAYNRSIYKINLSVEKKDFMAQVATIRDSVVIFEDVDTFNVSHKRDTATTDDASATNTKKDKLDRIVLSDILEVLDGYCYFDECIIIMTTNFIEKLDAALIRAGRMDHQICFANTTKHTIVKIIKYYYDEDIDPTTITRFDESTATLINLIIPNLKNYGIVRDYLTSV